MKRLIAVLPCFLLHWGNSFAGNKKRICGAILGLVDAVIQLGFSWFDYIFIGFLWASFSVPLGFLFGSFHQKTGRAVALPFMPAALLPGYSGSQLAIIGCPCLRLPYPFYLHEKSRIPCGHVVTLSISFQIPRKFSIRVEIGTPCTGAP